FSLRNIEVLLHPQQAPLEADDYVLLKKSRATPTSSKGGVLVVGLDSLLTQLARCCKPAPPDDIVGYVTRGKGVSIHRADCASFQQMLIKDSERVIEVTWGHAHGQTHVYPVDVAIEAFDRQGLLRDISEVFAKEKTNVIGVQTHSIKDMAYMTFTVEVEDSRRLQKVIALVRDVAGVRAAKRR
ncbi:MAG: hypothetical protein RLZZ24_1762, partial [Pseudomonadota bacterium]